MRQLGEEGKRKEAEMLLICVISLKAVAEYQPR